MEANEYKTKTNKSKKFDYDSIILNIKNDSYKYIGEGSGRRVYDLDNGYVAKVAKNAKGYAQNKVEYNIAMQNNSHLFANVLGVSENHKIIIMEKAEKVKHISFVLEYFDVKSNKELYHLKELQDVFHNYNLVLKDLGRASSWGKINNRPVIIDYGFTNEVQKKYYFKR